MGTHVGRSEHLRQELVRRECTMGPTVEEYRTISMVASGKQVFEPTNTLTVYERLVEA